MGLCGSQAISTEATTVLKSLKDHKRWKMCNQMECRKQILHFPLFTIEETCWHKQNILIILTPGVNYVLINFYWYTYSNGILSLFGKGR